VYNIFIVEYLINMPKKALIEYDHSLMQPGRHVAADEERQLHDSLGAALEALSRQKREGSVGFLAIPERRQELRAAEKMAADVANKFKTLIVIGIGGSDLGARALCRALKRPGKGMEVAFIGANTDPEEIADLLRRVDLKSAALNIISKSGDTIEPMSSFLLLRQRLIKAVGLKKHRERVIATTDAAKGTLRQISGREGYRTLPVPADIGGRFSALTTVGLFPAACAGIPVKELVAGAKEVLDGFFGQPPAKNGPLLFAGLHFEAYLRRTQHISVLMPYADGLKEFGAWFRQLWAESLGKKHDRQGKVVFHGLTPVAALGATDQHSQIQLYNEGPLDKIVTFIEVGSFRDDFTVPNAYPDIEGTAYMAGHSFEEIIHAERQATALALAKHGRPSGTLSIPAISPRAVGGLMFFFQLATAAIGELLDINVYDQPGVEEGKKAMYAILGRRGYELDAGRSAGK
jgi:glucose-6-phosphate isomerase